MQANETKIQSLFDSTRQYVIPLFQRPYSWEVKHWESLWQDLAELCDEEHPRTHFIGSIVNLPSRSVHEGVTKYVLIDGQQRLTTILVLLATIRDRAKAQPGNLADKIDDLLLKNRHQEGNEVHLEWLDTIGNLILTGYNSELSNADFDSKRVRLQESHCELNKHFSDLTTWDEQAIASRGEQLAEQALKIWPEFGGVDEDQSATIPAEGEIQEDVRDLIVKVLAYYGGEVARVTKGIRIFYKLQDGKVVNIKYSKKHSDYYWFGFHASLQGEMEVAGMTHAVFILMPNAFITLPIAVLKKYLADAGSTPKSDGTVRHYHILVSADSTPVFFHHGKPERISAMPYLTEFA